MHMTNNDLRDKAIEIVASYTKLGNKIFNTDMRKPHVDFSLKGRVGGQYLTRKHVVRVNMVLFAENYDDYIENVIPHEVAHAFQRHIHNAFCFDSGRRIMPHGREWKNIMIQFGKNPSTTHNYDVSNSTQKTVARDFIYNCGCRSYNFTIIRHRRAQKRQGTYSCRKCHTKLEYVGKDSIAA